MTKESFFNDINSWEDYVSKQDSLKISKDKGNTFELLTKVYFKISPQYSFYDDVWLLEETPEKILNEIGLHRQDLGIDLIAKSGNEYHAIQCKYLSDKHQKISYKKVSTFLNLIANYDKIKMGYICSTANLTTKNYDKVPKKLTAKILGDTWENLPLQFFENLRLFLKKKPLKLSVFKPRPHQKKALKDAIKYFENNKRGKLIFPCGSGKSLTGFWITRELAAKNILIAVPSLSLIKQTLDIYLSQIVARKEKAKWLCICSDDSIGKSDDVVMLTEDLGVPCVTDPIYINDWLKRNKLEHKIIFTTYQSGKLIAEISKKLKFSFDLGIYDEAHKTVGSDKSLFSHLLFEKNISVKKRVFMTATERFYSGSKDNIVSMDDIGIYGEVFSKMTFKEAIKKDLLTDYKIITLDIKRSEISDFIKQNGLVELNKRWENEPDARSLASMIALRKVMDKYPVNNAVSFHSSIEKARRNSSIHTYITKQYGYNPISTYTVSGKQPTSQRNDIVSDFAKTKKALITNARCLTEGVDVPNIDCIVFADPKRSKIDIVQALGRALRKKDGKKWGYVILPIVYGDDNEIDNESFNDVVSIIRGLAANDERIIEYFKTKTSSKGGGNKVESSDSVFEMISEEDLSDQLNIKVWEKLSKFNWMPYKNAKDYVKNLNIRSISEWDYYKKNEGKKVKIPVAPDQTYKDEWISWYDFLGKEVPEEFLSFKKARTLVRSFNFDSISKFNESRNKLKKLNKIPKHPDRSYQGEWTNWFDFLGNKTPQQEFNDFINDFKILAKNDNPYGRPYFPKSNAIGPSGCKVGSIFRTTVYSYENNSLPSWKKNKIKKELGSLFEFRSRDEWTWEYQFNIYKKWFKKSKTPYPPMQLKIEGFGIARWFYFMNRTVENPEKYLRKDKKGLEKISKLKDIGFPFIEKKDYDWNLKYNELKEIFEEYNGYPRFNRKSDNRMVTWVNKKTMNRMKFNDGSDIKSWFFKQQSAYKKGTMKENFPERIELLEKLRNWQWLD